MVDCAEVGHVHVYCTSMLLDSSLALLLNGNDQVLLGHQAVLCNVACEPSTEMCLSLKLVIECPVVIVGVREDAVNPSSNGTQSLHRVLLDTDTAGEMLVTVEERGGSVKRVKGVVQRRTLLWLLVSGTEEYPLLRGGHLDADFGIALLL